MADRYQDRPFPADDYDRGANPNSPARGESDPLAELARLIGQGSDDMALLMLLQEVVTDFEPGPALRAMIEPASNIDQQSSA